MFTSISSKKPSTSAELQTRKHCYPFPWKLILRNELKKDGISKQE